MESTLNERILLQALKAKQLYLRIYSGGDVRHWQEQILRYTQEIDALMLEIDPDIVEVHEVAWHDAKRVASCFYDRIMDLRDKLELHAPTHIVHVLARELCDTVTLFYSNTGG